MNNKIFLILFFLIPIHTQSMDLAPRKKPKIPLPIPQNLVGQPQFHTPRARRVSTETKRKRRLSWGASPGSSERVAVQELRTLNRRSNPSKSSSKSSSNESSPREIRVKMKSSSESSDSDQESLSDSNSRNESQELARIRKALKEKLSNEQKKHRRRNSTIKIKQEQPTKQYIIHKKSTCSEVSSILKTVAWPTAIIITAYLISGAIDIGQLTNILDGLGNNLTGNIDKLLNILDKKIDLDAALNILAGNGSLPETLVNQTTNTINDLLKKLLGR